ncbi:gamma-glutamyltransferase [Planctomycetota bacterium]
MKNSVIQKGRSALVVLCVLLVMGGCADNMYKAQLLEDPYVFEDGIVVSAHPIASEVGAEILKNGGNAVDAAVAVAYALAVVYPSAGNIGGGGFMVIRTADGEATAIDFREKAPGAAHRDMYLDEAGEVIKKLARDGALAAGVPGTVAGTLYALENYGTMDRRELIRPAIELADYGWILDAPIGKKEFKQFPSTHVIFNKPDGSRFEKGDLWVQKDLAKTLKIIAEKGRDGFYKGKVADLIVKTMENYVGIISHKDLEDYQPVERKPVTGNYRGYGIVSMCPPSSGGITMIEMLNILERYDIKSLGWNTPETVHLIVEAERRAYADRAEYIADPDFIDVPAERLISKEFADMRAQDIDPAQATPSEQVTHGDVTQAPYESEDTTHFSVVDKDGMAVAVTYTIERGYGSYLVVEGAGFLLNNQMGDFSAKTGVPNSSGLVYGTANAIEANKRMLSSMTPTIITKDGRNFMVIGSPGGPTIITTVLQCIMNVIDHGMTIRDAVAAGRFHHQWLPDKIQHEKDAFSAETIAGLEKLGHSLDTRELGDAQGIVIDLKTGLLMGGPDPRGRGAAKGIK